MIAPQSPRDDRPTPRLLAKPDGRLAAGVFIFALVYGLVATRLTAGGFSDPLGPRAFPLLLAVLMMVAAVLLALGQSDHRYEFPERSVAVHVLLAAAALAGYGYLLEVLGYPLSTIALVSLLSLMFGGPRNRSIVAATALSGLLFVLFSVVLGLYLPALPSF